MFRLIILILIPFLAAMAPPCQAQTIYLNSYVQEPGIHDNYIFKIDLDEKRVVDSLRLPRRGDFSSNAPITLNLENYCFLISALVDGLPAKNAQIRNTTYSYYYVVDERDFAIAGEDSLIGKMLGSMTAVNLDTTMIELLDKDNGGWTDNIYIIDTLSAKLRYLGPNPPAQEPSPPIIIGKYYAPKLLMKGNGISYYWGFDDENDTTGDSAFVNLMAVESDSLVIRELRLGICTKIDIVIGYSALTGKIYVFLTTMKLLSMYPLIETPDYIDKVILVINPENFDIERRIPLEMGDAYASQETGTAKSMGPYLYYYYFRQDGYGRFDPAYMLIFDTRTKEATWLRVGWR